MLAPIAQAVLDAHTHVLASLWALEEPGIRLYYCNARAREVWDVNPLAQDVYLGDILRDPAVRCEYAREIIRLANTGGRIAEVRRTPYGTLFVEGRCVGEWVLYLAYELRELADELEDFVVDRA